MIGPAEIQLGLMEFHLYSMSLSMTGHGAVAAAKKQQIPHYDIDRTRLENLLEMLNPSTGHIKSFKVLRRLGYYLVEAPVGLTEVSIGVHLREERLIHSNSDRLNVYDSDNWDGGEIVHQILPIMFI